MVNQRVVPCSVANDQVISHADAQSLLEAKDAASLVSRCSVASPTLIPPCTILPPPSPSPTPQSPIFLSCIMGCSFVGRRT